MTRRGGALMSNHFFRVTSNGGYIGRWVWCNSGTDAVVECGYWGQIIALKDCKNLIESVWAGSIWVFRMMTQ
jgi:hypothetical protein